MTGFRAIPYVLLGVALAAAVAGCGAGAPAGAAVEVVDSAGVVIVWNRAEDRPLGWRFQPELVLGGADDGPEAFFRIGAGSIASDAAGNLYVLDRGNHHVLVFDWQGRHLRTLGGRGGGPGELEWPAGLVVSPDGAVSVSDIGKRGLVRFDPAGRPLPQQLLEGWAGGQVAHTGTELVVEVQERVGDDVVHRLLALGTHDHRTLLTWDPPPMRPVDFGCVRISAMAPIFAPSLVWSAGPGRIAATTDVDYRVDIYEDGRHVASIRRDLPPRPATRTLAVQEVGDEFTVSFGGGGGCTVPAERVVDERGHAPVIGAVGQLAAEPDGTIWVRRRGVRGEEMPTDVFASSGEYLGTLPADAPWPVAFTPDGRVIAVERDELDVPRIVVYGVTDAEGWAG